TPTAPPSGATVPPPPGTSPPATSAPSPQGRPMPAQQPAPPTGPARPGTPVPTTAPSTPTTTFEAPQGPAAPEKAAEIQKLRTTRQSTAPNVQQQALAELNCSAEDPLLGFDDANLPLVTCSQDNNEKFILEPAFLDGQRIGKAAAGPNPKGAGYVVTLDFDAEGTKKWGDFTSANVRERAAFGLDGEVVSEPRP